MNGDYYNNIGNLKVDPKAYFPSNFKNYLFARFTTILSYDALLYTHIATVATQLLISPYRIDCGNVYCMIIVRPNNL
jgi:hypothetical protein